MYFASQSTVVDDNRSMPQLPNLEYSFQTITISSQEVKDVLLNLNVNKACGQDLISPRFLKEGAVTLASPFSIVLNRSLEQGYFRSSWKHVNVTPIHKKDNKSLPSNYRPITILSQIGKTVERCVHNHMYNYVLARQFSLRFNLDLYRVTQLHISYFIHTTPSVTQ